MGPKGEPVEITFDFVIPSRSLQGQIKNMVVVEDFESRPHKAAFLAERDMEFQELRDVRMPKALPGYSD